MNFKSLKSFIFYALLIKIDREIFTNILLISKQIALIQILFLFNYSKIKEKKNVLIASLKTNLLLLILAIFERDKEK